MKARPRFGDVFHQDLTNGKRRLLMFVSERSPFKGSYLYFVLDDTSTTVTHYDTGHIGSWPAEVAGVLVDES